MLGRCREGPGLKPFGFTPYFVGLKPYANPKCKSKDFFSSSEAPFMGATCGVAEATLFRNRDLIRGSLSPGLPRNKGTDSSDTA